MTTTIEQLAEQLDLSEQLQAGRSSMMDPQNLPGRFGRVIEVIDRVLGAANCEAVMAGGWAVWRHGYVGRVTHDVDIVLPADRVEEFLRVAAVSGFAELPRQTGRWPKVQHKETDITVDILPEGERPGTADRPAPTTIRHPAEMGGQAGVLRYIEFESLIELKLAAGRARDEADIVELLLTKTEAEIADVRNHLQKIHTDYLVAFERLVERANSQEER